MRLAPWFALCTLLAACGDDDPSLDEQEVITTVILSFTPTGGGAPLVFEFDDPDGDGGAAPTVDSISLTHLATYGVTVRFENRLETPPEDITAEIEDEAEAHQVFFTGTALDGALTHTYSDTDASGLPVGLENTMSAMGGAGDLVVTLRHLPPVNGAATKTDGLAAQVRASGFDGLPGETDARVIFPVAIPVP
jgi:hypothetical protein